MTYREVYSRLRKAGTASNIAIYKRHGAKMPMFGVSFKELTALKKRIKIDHELALRLWASKNTDARIRDAVSTPAG